ncbi:MAG: polyprenyl synthetase family protein [Candidatus Paceibacterota bacterium]|jgi:excisionase family DNA binding protein
MEKIEDRLYFTTSEVARLLKVSRITVFNHIKKGLIKANKLGKTYLISHEEVVHLVGKSPLTNELHETDKKIKSDKFKYRLYLASGISLWRTFFNPKYARYFNRKVRVFQPGELDNPVDHRFIPIGIACYDLNEINHADALLVYMKKYLTRDGAPTGTDSTWECGYAIGHAKPVIMLVEDLEHLDYYAVQWMVSFSINAILTTNREVAKICRNHPKFVHATIILAENEEQFENKIIEYLDNYYRSIYSRSGLINYKVDAVAREIFSRNNLEGDLFNKEKTDSQIKEFLDKLKGLKFETDKDSLAVCEVEREVSEYLRGKISLQSINQALATVVEEWQENSEKILACLTHSILPPFKFVEGRHSGTKKTRPELFFELYDLVTHHLTLEQRFIKSPDFPAEVGAILELYNWTNTYALDDVFDNSKMRQKEPTVWQKFSRRDAVYTGIVGHLLTLKYLLTITREKPELGLKMAEIMNDYNHTMYEGQVFDIALTFDSDEKKDLLKKKNFEEILNLYVKRIYGICGGFYEAIGLLSATAGNKEEQILNAEQINKISPLVGMYYGIIQMIRNDLGDYLVVEEESGLSKGMKGESHSDIKEGKVDLAYLVALYADKLSPEDKEFLYQSLGDKELNAQAKEKINQLLWQSGAVDLVVELLINLIDHVKNKLLTEYQETPTRMKWMFSLMAITKEILNPFKRQALRNGWQKYEFDPVLLEKVTSGILELEKTK